MTRVVIAMPAALCVVVALTHAQTPNGAQREVR
jgi:hypothetical protein